MRVLTVYAHPNPKSFCHAILEQFTKGLEDGGHTSEVIDLYEIGFDPVFNMNDYAFFADETVPDHVLEGMNLKQQVLQLSGGPLRRFLAKRWMQNKTLSDVVRLIRRNRPKDVREQQEQVSRAQGLAFIAPVFWMHFPAILKGWIERVFTYGFAYSLTPEGWQGDVTGRVPLLKHEKALIINTTFFSEDAYEAALGEAMAHVVDSWGFRYPGVKNVEHVYFHAVNAVGATTRQEYLRRAHALGKEF